MATYKVMKGNIGYTDIWLWKFARDLTACVKSSCKDISTAVSILDSSAYGGETRVAKGGTGTSSAGVNAFTANIKAPHANAYVRHLVSVVGRTTRMDLGNLVEQVAYEKLKTYWWYEGINFVYNCSKQLEHFPISYVGNIKSARPDFRYAFKGQEAVFDITTDLQAGHILEKRVNKTTLGNHPNIPIAVEVIWQEPDFWQRPWF
jgi:hypothetical protein